MPHFPMLRRGASAQIGFGAFGNDFGKTIQLGAVLGIRRVIAPRPLMPQPTPTGPLPPPLEKLKLMFGTTPLRPGGVTTGIEN